MLQHAVASSALELGRLWSSASRSEDWWAQRGLSPGDWHALAANTLVEVHTIYRAQRRSSRHNILSVV